MGKETFIKLNLELVKQHGESVATLYAFLSNISRIWKKDERGYMSIWTQYIAESLGWDRKKLVRVREQLRNIGLIDYRQGKNQNEQPKYKVL